MIYSFTGSGDISVINMHVFLKVLSQYLPFFGREATASAGPEYMGFARRNIELLGSTFRCKNKNLII